MKVEWSTPVGRDGKPLPSLMHGWLTKMRGTLLGNEKLRSTGIREMKHAHARKERGRTRRHKKGSRGILSWFTSKPVPPSRSNTRSSHRSTAHRSHSTRTQKSFGHGHGGSSGAKGHQRSQSTRSTRHRKPK